MRGELYFFKKNQILAQGVKTMWIEVYGYKTLNFIALNNLLNKVNINKHKSTSLKNKIVHSSNSMRR